MGSLDMRGERGGGLLSFIIVYILHYRLFVGHMFLDFPVFRYCTKMIVAGTVPVFPEAQIVTKHISLSQRLYSKLVSES